MDASILVVNNKATNYCTTLAVSRGSSGGILVYRGTRVGEDNYLTTNMGTLGTCVIRNEGPRSCIRCTGGSTSKVIERSLLLAVSRGLGRMASELRGLNLMVLGSRGKGCIAQNGQGLGVGNRGVGPVLTSTIRGTGGMAILGHIGVFSCSMGSGGVGNTFKFNVRDKVFCAVRTGTIVVTANNTTKLCGPGGPKFSHRGV